MSTLLLSPAWYRLHEVASRQDGLFTSADAKSVGYSRQLLAYHLESKRIRRIRRGLYQIVAFPIPRHFHWVATWLWSGRVGVFSFESALFLHGLAEKPEAINLTLPDARGRQRNCIPSDIIVDHRSIPVSDCTHVGVLPVTTVRRTLEDLRHSFFPLETLRVAVDRALAQNLVQPNELEIVDEAFPLTAAR